MPKPEPEIPGFYPQQVDALREYLSLDSLMATPEFAGLSGDEFKGCLRGVQFVLNVMQAGSVPVMDLEE